MRIGRIAFVGTCLLAGVCWLVGCGSSITNEYLTGEDSTGNVCTVAAPEVATKSVADESEPIYGTEPLIPAIQLDGESSFSAGPIVGAPIVGTFPISVGRNSGGLNSGILAPDFTADPSAAFHPHGTEVCASGCAASNHATPKLTRAEFQRLRALYNRGPLDENNAALESLLFYGRQTARFFKQAKRSAANIDHDAFLQRELKKTHVLLSFRIVDDKGVVRVEMKQTRVPLDRRHVFDMKTRDLQPLVTSGTVKRVGLHHLWTRL